jgi:hypothetical protein
MNTYSKSKKRVCSKCTSRMAGAPPGQECLKGMPVISLDSATQRKEIQYVKIHNI